MSKVTYTLISLYFFTLHADQLHIPFGLWNIRFNNVLALFLIIYLSINKRLTLKLPYPILFSLLLLCLSMTISYFASADFVRSTGYYLMFYFTLICYFFLPILLISNYSVIRILNIYISSFYYVGLYATIQFLLSLIGIYDPFANQKLSFMVRPNAFAYEPSFYALYLAPGVFFVNYLAINRIRLFNSYNTVLINIYYILSTSTGIVIGYLVFLLLMLKKIKKILFPIAIMISVTIILYSLFPFFFETFYFKLFVVDLTQHHSFYERWIQIENSFHVFKNNPIFGVGIGGVGTYIYEGYISGEPYLLRATENNLTVKSFDPMNVMTEILASLGLFGMIAFLIFFYSIRKQVKCAIKINRYSLSKAYVLSGLLISSILALIVLQMNQGLFRTYTWVHLGVTLGVALKWSRDA